MKRWIFTLTLALLLTPASLLACAILIGNYQLEAIQNGVAVGQEETAQAKHCETFKISEKGIRNFFSNSFDITPEEKQKKYQWSPCQVTGTLINGEEKADFAIFASNIGKLTYPDGKVQWLACKKCLGPK